MEIWVVQDVDLGYRTLLPATVRTTVLKKEGDARVGDQQTELLEEFGGVLQ